MTDTTATNLTPVSPVTPPVVSLDVAIVGQPPSNAAPLPTQTAQPSENLAPQDSGLKDSGLSLDFSDVDISAPAAAAELAESMDESSIRVGRLLAGLKNAAPAPSNQPTEDARFENHLAVVRLGIATSLFYALRTKHAPTAAHCLRVALSCSAWAERMGLDGEARDRIEVAALLHDLGKIGIPDRVLRKPGKLSVDEQLSMELTPPLGVEILRGCTGDTELLDIVLYAGTWYDSRRQGEGPRGDALPMGARMLSIADAFDSMTTDTVYRRAMSRERAIQELIQGSHTQFDPELVLDFSRLLEEKPEILQGCVVNRWLKGLQQSQSDSMWSAESYPAAVNETARRETFFFNQLLGNLKDAVAFTDGEGTITQWNDAMRLLTDVPSSAMVGQRWNHSSLRLRDVHETVESSSDRCVVEECLKSQTVVKRPMMIERPGDSAVPVHVTVSPVSGSEPGIHGTVIIIHDMSDQATMQQQLETLHEKSTQDPLTKVANRAHFDDFLNAATQAAINDGVGFSLIICDIDHFKNVNDVHGHPAGDEALKGFANVLQSHSRDGDLVARYGGEEFLLLSPNCDNATASRRAEAIRVALEGTPLPSLNNEAVTASFGVTEFQPGDSPETVLSRADRALLKAKDNGRNRVIQLGAGNKPHEVSDKREQRSGWFGWFQGTGTEENNEFDIITPVPVDLAIEKLRGFIADHSAEIISVKENQVSMKLTATYSRGGRRRADQQMGLQVELTLSEAKLAAKGNRGKMSKTNVHVFLQTLRSRDRRSREVGTCYNQVMHSLRSYLMGEIVSP